MYIPHHFAEPRVDILHQLIQARPLCTLVTPTPGGLDANHVPLHLSEAPAPFGTLRGHVARANPMWREVVPGSEVLAIFQGPEAYVTPSWYPTKAETGKVVPTWNYAVAHAYGILRVVEDSTWVRTQIEALTAHNEAAFAAPWQVSDAPHEYIDKLLGAVVGIEIVITRLVGKWKTSQNQAESNREGVAHGLRGLGGEEAIAMADLVDAARPSR